MEKYNISALSNGIQLVSEYIPYVKSFSIGFWFNVGARDENERNNGISHFIEHMVFKGTRKRTAKQLSDAIESYGGYLNAFTGKEHTCYYGRGLSENLRRTFDVISDMIQNPLFRDYHIKKEAGVVIDELNDINDNPEELIFDKFEEILFSGSPLSLPIIGRENNILNFNSPSLHKYHKEKYLGSNLLIVASGDVKHENLLKTAENYLYNEFTSAAPRKLKKANPVSGIHLINKEIQQVHSIIGRETFGYKSDNRLKIKVLSTLLGEGSSSRLFQSVREKLGITYQINSFLNSFYDVSAFGVYFSTNEKHLEKVTSIILKEFKRLRETKVGEKELNRVKEYLKGSIILSLENTTNRMIRISNSLLYFNRILSAEEVLKKIDAVTAEDILNLAGELLVEKELVSVTLKPAEPKKNKAA
ncbi:MAG: insulinase family protein [Ignavibacteriaceae bacterium]|nr:insulinase family protein [Ignavibacteriaceae bacterium]